MTNHTVRCSAVSREQQIPEFFDALVSSVSRTSGAETSVSVKKKGFSIVSRAHNHCQKSIKSAPQSGLRLNFQVSKAIGLKKWRVAYPLGWPIEWVAWSICAACMWQHKHERMNNSRAAAWLPSGLCLASPKALIIAMFIFHPAGVDSHYSAIIR